MRSTHQRGGTLSGINVTPLTDVLLVLLITFLLSAPAFESSQLPVPLPRTALQSELEREMELVVLDPQGRELMMEGSIGSALSEARLADLKESSAHETLGLACHRDLPYGALYRILEQARTAGWQSVVVLTEPRS